MQVKFKKLSEQAVTPSYSKQGDAGMDLTATSVRVQQLGLGEGGPRYIEYGTSIALEIPEGYVGLIFPRSSISNKDLSLCNSVGIIDSKFRGEIKLRFNLTEYFWSLEISDDIPFGYATAEEEMRDIQTDIDTYSVGDRIGQLVILPYPQIKLEEVEELSVTERNDGAFGSTG